MEVVSGPHGHETVHYQAPEAESLPALMEEFLNWFNGSAETDLLVRAGIAHLWFLTLHPFDDGNGRIARALTENMLAHDTVQAQPYLSISAYIEQHKSEYYDQLEHAQKGDSDITEWLTWFLQAYLGAAQQSLEQTDRAVALSAVWIELEARGLNDRQRKIMRKFLDDFEGKLTAKKWAAMCKVSHHTAVRDINDLIDKGVLVRSEAGSRSTSYDLSPEFDKRG